MCWRRERDSNQKPLMSLAYTLVSDFKKQSKKAVTDNHPFTRAKILILFVLSKFKLL